MGKAEENPLERCRVVLVQPQFSGNIGATARVMRNLGFSELVLVAPEGNPADRQARQLAAQGEEILDRARIVPDLGAAVADCVLVIGTSARVGGLFRRQTVLQPGEVMPVLLQSLVENHAAALVFGPEARGLTNAEVTRCHYLCHIATDSGYPALNLAQAAAICLYELRSAWLHQKPGLSAASPLASFAAQEHLFGQVQTALEKIHFLYGPKAPSLMHALRHLLGRARLTPLETDILLGLARQIHWYVDHGDRENHLPPDQEES